MPPTVFLHLPPGPDAAAVPPRTAFARVLARAGARRGEVTLVLVAADELRRLNRTYRRRDYDTDVLSFDYREPGEDQAGTLWGDVFVSADAARRQARERGIPAREELARLFLHGALHLMGYRDGTPREAARMERVQESLLRELLAPAARRRVARRPAPDRPGADRGGGRAPEEGTP